MISKRFLNDGQTVFPINKRQEEALRKHLQKLSSGYYTTEDVACPICGTEGGEVLAEKDRYGIPMTVVLCPACGLIRTNPRMTQQSYANFYGEDYRQLYGGSEFPDDDFFNHQHRHGEQIVRICKAAGLKIGPGVLVMEVGCGAGGILGAFRDQGADVLGCDLGEAFLKYGRDQKGLNLVKGFLTDLTPPRKADLIVYSHVLEHVLDLKKELAAVSQFLAENGRLYIEIPSVKNIHNAGYCGDFLILLQNAHTYHFTLRSLQNLLATCGFRMVFGDEFVHAIFAVDKPGSWESDYAAVRQFLLRSETTRFLYWMRPAFFRRTLARWMPHTFKSRLRKWTGR